MSKPELVIKHVYGWSEDYRLAFRPGFCLFGSKAGLLWLAARLTAHAEQIDEAAPYNPSGPDAVEDLWETAPWNRQLSDEVHLTLGSYAESHRRRALPALNVTRASRLAGPPTKQWARLLTEMADWIESDGVAQFVLDAAGRERVADSFAELAETAAAVALRVRDSCLQDSTKPKTEPPQNRK